MTEKHHSAIPVRIRYLLPASIVLVCIIATYFLSVRLFSLIQYQRAENRIRIGDVQDAVNLLNRGTKRLPTHTAWKTLGNTLVASLPV